MPLTSRELSFIDAAKAALERAAAIRVERFVSEFDTTFPETELTAVWYEQGTHTIKIDGSRLRQDGTDMWLDVTGAGHNEELEAEMSELLRSIFIDLDEITMDGRMDITIPPVNLSHAATV